MVDLTMALLMSQNPSAIPGAVANASSAILQSISSVGPSLPTDQVQNAVGLAQSLSTYATSFQPADTAFILGTAQALYNTYQGILFSIGAPAPSNPGNVATAARAFSTVYQLGGCALLAQQPIVVSALQDALAQSNSGFTGYQRGVYDFLTAAALASVSGSAPLACTTAPAAAVTPVPIAPASSVLPPLPAPPAATSTPTVQTEAPSTGSSSTPWIVGGAVVVGAGVLWLVLRKKR